MVSVHIRIIMDIFWGDIGVRFSSCIIFIYLVFCIEYKNIIFSSTPRHLQANLSVWKVNIQVKK